MTARHRLCSSVSGRKTNQLFMATGRCGAQAHHTKGKLCRRNCRRSTFDLIFFSTMHQCYKTWKVLTLWRDRS
ncbi:uncharacterized protein ARMOST_18099 [Armillaria ostoyae]|uniref:Uncharacterized protein n=1 Tax=Armillaria ostoyae TaxID=47428 RepID=A0A284S0V4_ARMOS|nr:uncharacterized protein ARMOST_18099 [Armillaria ostoyae]